MTRFGVQFTNKVSNMDKRTPISELSESVLKGVQEALRKLVEERAAQDKTLVIGDRNGNIKNIPAKELLKTLPPQ